MNPLRFANTFTTRSKVCTTVAQNKNSLFFRASPTTNNHKLKVLAVFAFNHKDLFFFVTQSQTQISNLEYNLFQQIRPFCFFFLQNIPENVGSQMDNITQNDRKRHDFENSGQ